MDNLRAAVQFSETLQEMIDSGKARMATVVASYGNEVDARLADGSVARFPSTATGLQNGHPGALITAADGGKLFVAIGVGTEVSEGVSWGSITGTLSSQIDLQSALTLKFNKNDYKDVNADWYSNINDSLAAAGEGGTVRFTRGVSYSASSPLLLRNDQHIIGGNAHLALTGDVGFKSLNTATQVSRARIEGLTIYGGNNLGIGVDFSGMVDSHISDFSILNWVDYGIKFGGEFDTGGWSNSARHGRIWSSPASSKSDSAGILIKGPANTSLPPNGNNITVFDVRMQSNLNHAIVVDRGDGNRIIGCDMGYAVANNGFTAVLLRGGSTTRGNVFTGNRYEKASGSLLIENASDNMFIGEYFGTPVSAYTLPNVRVTGGTGNIIEPTHVGVGAAGEWISMTASGNTARYRGVDYSRTNADLPESSRAPGDAFNRYERSMNGATRWGSGSSSPDVQLDRHSANTLRLAHGDSFLIDGGGWNTGNLRLGVGHMWRDASGNVRWKSGSAPTSDTDGDPINPFQNTHRANVATTPRAYPGTSAPTGAGISINTQVALLIAGGNHVVADGVNWVQIYHPSRGIMWVNSTHLTAL